MAIKRIKVSNFKSFDEVDLELGNFSVLIGANASGKSNFIQAFKFLRDSAQFGLDSAISMQGGIEYFRNLNIGSSKNFSIEVACDTRESYMVTKEKLTIEGYEATYRFELTFTGVSRFEVVEEKLLQKCNFYGQTEKGKTTKEKLGKGEIVVYRSGNERGVSFKPPKGVDIDSDGVFEVNMTRRFLTSAKMIPKSLLIQGSPFPFGSSFLFIGASLKNNISGISTYDFDPRLSKKAQTITGKVELEEDGSNLAIVLKNIMRSGNNRRKLFNLLQETLPFVNNLTVETFADKSLIFKLRESYSGRKFLPASLLSDGTINITALITALYFGEKPSIIIEEPDRNVHPYLISRIVSMMKEASKTKQIIITTHNPQIVKYVDIKDILLISRNRQGLSSIHQPSESKEINTFLKNEIGIDELFVQNLMGV